MKLLIKFFLFTLFLSHLNTFAMDDEKFLLDQGDRVRENLLISYTDKITTIISTTGACPKGAYALVYAIGVELGRKGSPFRGELDLLINHIAGSDLIILNPPIQEHVDGIFIIRARAELWLQKMSSKKMNDDYDTYLRLISITKNADNKLSAEAYLEIIDMIIAPKEIVRAAPQQTQTVKCIIQ